jgi:uncharacterized membrane protein
MDFTQLIGRLHPLVLHFPIALILLAAAVEVVRLRWDGPALAQLVPFLLGVGAFGAVASSVTGWIFAEESVPRPDLRWALNWHRWLGLAATVLAGGAAWMARRHANAATPFARWSRRVAVWLAALVLSGAAHLGALMVWGEDHFDVSE